MADSVVKDHPGYGSGSSNSGTSGMDSSRGVPTSPTATMPGTVENGHPGTVSGNKAPRDAR